MTTERYLISENIRLDRVDERVWFAGNAVRLGGKAFALLRTLMERPQTLVGKSDLFEEVWNGLAVSDSVLTTAIKELRQGLGDDARAPHLIETVHGRGYRFLLPVSQQDIYEPLSPQLVAAIRTKSSVQSRHKWLIGGTVALATLALLWIVVPTIRPEPAAGNSATFVHPKSVAVLPFRDLSVNADQRWFAEGLADELQSRLTRTPDLRVVSNSMTADYRGQSGAASTRAQTRGVAHVLEGSVRRSGERIRITVELTRTADGVQLWSQTYDRPADDVIAIQEDIAFSIASALRTVMEPAKLAAMVAAGTRSVEAYEAYLLARSEDQRALATGGRQHTVASAAAYEKARLLDPNFAEAHWQSAQRWFGKQTRINGSINAAGVSDQQQLSEYMNRVEQAIASSANDVDRLKYVSAKAVMQMELRKAHRLMVAYLAARPRDIDAWEHMAELAVYANEHRWIVRAGERIHTLSIEAREPRSRGITVTAMAMQLDDAAARARQQMRLRPASIMTSYQAHRALIWAGEVDEARQLLDRIKTSQLPERNKILAQMRQYCADGQNDAANFLRARIDALGSDYSDRWMAAQIVGDSADAVAILKPLDRDDRLLTLMQFMMNPSFESARFSVLSAALASDGVVRWKVWPMPGACKATPR